MPEVLDFMFKLDVAFNNGFSQPARTMTGELSKLQAATQKLNASLGNISAYERTSSSIKTTASRLEYLRTCYRDSAAAADRSRERTAQLSVQHEQAKQRVQQYSATLPKNSMYLMLAKKREQELAQALKQSERETQKYTQERDKLYRQVGQASEALDTEKRNLQEMGDALRAAGVNTDRLTEEQQKLSGALDRVQKAHAKMTELREKLSWGNIKADIMKSAAIIKTFEQPIRVNMDFEQAMAQVKAVLNPTREEFELLERQAKELAASTQFSATQAANSQENLARAGFSTTKIIGMMPQVLNVAAADGMELAQAADIIGASLRGFNLDETHAQRIADLLAYTSSHSSTNVAMAGAAMQGVAGTARTQNISPEKIAAYIGVLANYGGIQGTEAATTLERAISALAVRKGDTDKVLSQYGIATVHKETGRMRTLESIVTELYNKTESKGAVAQQAAFMQVFGKAYGGSMLKFVQGVKSGELSTLETGLTSERDNAAANMAKMRNDTLKGDLTSLSSAWEGLMIKVGESLTPINRFFTKTLTEAIQKLTVFMTEHKGFFDAAIQAVYLWGAFKISSTVIKYFNLGLEFFSAWRTLKTAEQATGLLTAAQNAGTLATHIGGAAKSASLFGMSLSTALGVIGAIITASVLIYQHWEEITAAAQRYGEVLKQTDTSKIEAAKAGTLSRSDASYGEAAMYSTYYSPGLAPRKKNALGGIYRSPIWTWAAEAGPEAIIPLSNKSRGVPLLMQAAQMLGITSQRREATPTPISQPARPTLYDYAVAAADNGESIYDVKELGENVRNYSVNQGDNIRNDNSRNISLPAVNLSVNISGQNGGSANDLAGMIAGKVKEVLREIMSVNERVAFA